MSHIYIADLAEYNAGRLVGRWIEMTEDHEDNLERINDALAEMEEATGSEEFVVHDYNDEAHNMGETSDWERLAAWQALALSEEAFVPALEAFGDHYLSDNYDEAMEFINDRYRGNWRSAAEYVEEFVGDVYGDVPSWLTGYIDFDKMADDFNGTDITVVDGGIGVFIFANA
ncbi:MAG: antirestriction protein ArdA [Planctomycetota bacterium]|nr:antirestriction protein ArdA [Planctomycetota bacterium]